ncbi:MAG: histidine ammonia-lyase, partial [Albidovulum sp.]
SVILAIEMLCGAQGVEARAPLATSPVLQAVVARLRQDVATLGEDRYLAPDIEAATALVRSGAITKAAGVMFAL